MAVLKMVLGCKLWTTCVREGETHMCGFAALHKITPALKCVIVILAVVLFDGAQLGITLMVRVNICLAVNYRDEKWFISYALRLHADRAVVLARAKSRLMSINTLLVLKFLIYSARLSDRVYTDVLIQRG